MKKILVFIFCSALISGACVRDTDNDMDPVGINPNPDSMEELIINANFDYNTSKEVIFNIKAMTNNDDPIAGVRFDVYTDNPENGGYLLFSGITNSRGTFYHTHSIATYYREVYIKTRYLGLPSGLHADIVNRRVDFVFGGKNPKYKRSFKYARNPSFFRQNLSSVYNYLSSYDNSGVPSNLVIPGDTISSSLLNDINSSLPENRPVPQYNPEYLATGNETDVLVVQDADIWVTFVHEGAGYYNTLGFYTYNTNNPPTSKNQIDTIHIIFPNASYPGHGGNLASGSKVKLGTFPANTGIGWVLLANAWNGSSVGSAYYTFYSEPDFNPESIATKRQHIVVLSDPGRDLVLLGFEDMKRTSGSDDDFNDLIFYVTANPITAVSSSNLPIISYKGTDTDNDGVSDVFDDYPNDGTKAFNNYYPGEGVYGTLAFEDLWPGMGDYDFNDLVVDYNFNHICDADNKVVEVKAEIITKAIGASYQNGFGFETNLPPSAVSSVTGLDLQENIITLSANNTEAGQSKAVIIAYDNAFNRFPYTGYSFVNTDPNNPSIDADTQHITITLNNPETPSDVGVPPYNPFIFVGQTRNKEVHLPDYPPTSLMNNSIFGTASDDSKPAQGRYYKSDNNLPWVLHVSEGFDYPVEFKDITTVHNKFSPWAQSNGTTYKDWYKNKPGYRNISFVY